MDPAQEFFQNYLLLRQTAIKKATVPGDSTIQKFYDGKTIFVTGGSGFMGKVFIEKICRACDVNNIYMLIRPKKNKTPQERLAEILKDPAFDWVREEKPGFANKLIAIEGDINEIRLGLGDNDWNTIVNEVDMIFHLAANVRFDVDLKEAILSNIRGTCEILTLSKSCTKLKAHVHVSTAYTFATDDRFGGQVLEEFQSCPADPEVVIKMAETMSKEKLDDLTSALLEKWPNTYTFTKAIAEEAIRTMSDGLPICVVRPAIVIPSAVEPVPGWLDISNVYGPSGMVLGLGMGVIHTLFAKKAIKIGFTPADLVINAIAAAGWEIGSKPVGDDKKIEIFTVSNIRNPIIWDFIGPSVWPVTMNAVKGLKRRVKQIKINNGQFYMLIYNVLDDEDKHCQAGDIMKTYRTHIASPKSLWYCEALQTNNTFIFWLSTLLFHFIPAYLVDGVCFILGKERRFVKLYKKMHKLSHVLSYFTRHDWQFSDANTHRLYMKMSRSDQVIFNFDIQSIDWSEMIQLWWIGLRKFIIKDGLKDTNYGNMKQRILFIPHCLVFVFYLYLFIKLLSLFYVGLSLLF